MTNVKQQVRELLDRLPDDCSVEDIQYQLYVTQTIRHRLDLAERCEAVSQADAEERFDKWRIK